MSTLEADKQYLRILLLAAQHGETQIDRILSALAGEASITAASVEGMLTDGPGLCAGPEIPPVELAAYDVLRGAA